MIINKSKIYIPNPEFLWLKRSTEVGSPYCCSVLTKERRVVFQELPSAARSELELFLCCPSLTTSSLLHPHLLPLWLLLWLFPGKEALLNQKQLHMAINSTPTEWQSIAQCSSSCYTYWSPPPTPLHSTAAHTYLQHNPKKVTYRIKFKHLNSRVASYVYNYIINIYRIIE